MQSLAMTFGCQVHMKAMKTLTIKPIICTNFSHLFLEWNSTCLGQFPCPSSGVFHCTHNNAICHTGLQTACEQDKDGAPSLSCSQAVSKPVWHIPLLCVKWKTPDDGQRNCPKHVEFYSKNKFEKLVHLIGFIIRINHDSRSPERQIRWRFAIRILSWQRFEPNIFEVQNQMHYCWPRLFIRIFKIYERSKAHSLSFRTAFWKHIESVEMILSLRRDRPSSYQVHMSAIFAPEDGASCNPGDEVQVSI